MALEERVLYLKNGRIGLFELCSLSSKLWVPLKRDMDPRRAGRVDESMAVICSC